MGQNSEKSHHERNTQRIRDEHADGSKIGASRIERIRDELVDGSKVTARKHERIDGEVLMDRKLNQDDGVKEQYVNHSGIRENGSEHAACEVKVHEKVVTTWLFDTGADAHVMPKCVWEQLGEHALQTTDVTL